MPPSRTGSRDTTRLSPYLENLYRRKMEDLKKLLAKEAQYKLRDEVMDHLLDSMTEVRLKTNDIVIEYGTLNSDIYILKDGILRLVYLNGETERTYAFALPGTMLLSYHVYCMHQPAFMQVEACTESTILKMSRRDFDNLMEESHEFSLWMTSSSLQQLYFLEWKLSVINGTAKERFISLVNNRPEIMEKVSLKVIASYLGITPEYLSKLKREFLRNRNR